MLRLLTLALVAGSLFAASASARALLPKAIDGVVVRVKDGDSVELLRGSAAFNDRVSEVRLAGIDAPEYQQPYGRKARAALARMVADKRVTLRVTDRDRYGRLVGHLLLNGRDVNLLMAAGGHAWAYSRYDRDPAILAAASRARAQRLGLWALPPEKRLPPPVWRERHPRRP